MISNTRPRGSLLPVMNLMMDMDSVIDMLKHLDNVTTSGGAGLVQRGEVPKLFVGDCSAPFVMDSFKKDTNVRSSMVLSADS